MTQLSIILVCVCMIRHPGHRKDEGWGRWKETGERLLGCWLEVEGGALAVREMLTHGNSLLSFFFLFLSVVWLIPRLKWTWTIRTTKIPYGENKTRKPQAIPPDSGCKATPSPFPSCFSSRNRVFGDRADQELHILAARLQVRDHQLSVCRKWFSRVHLH